MRLFVKSPNGQKIYLKIKARTRSELRQRIGKDVFSIRGVKYKISDVFAESGSNSTITGAVLGGVIGLLGGPIGVLSGATAGGLLGYNDEERENELVDRFNKSKNLWRQKGR